MLTQDKARTLRIEFAVPNFFAIPLKRVEIEAVQYTGRTYFIHRGAIVAVASRSGSNQEAQ
jgi:hypothetical protein